MFKFFKKMNLMRKFIILLILFVIVPVVLIDLLITKKVESITEEQVSSALYQLVSASHFTLERENADYDDKTEKIMISEEIQQLVKPSLSEFDSIDKFNSVDIYLRKYSSSSSQISYSLFFPDDNQLYSFAPFSNFLNKGVFYFNKQSSLSWYEDASGAKGRGIVRVIRKFGNNPGDLNTVAYLRQLNSIYEGQKVIGYLVITGLETQYQKDILSLNSYKDAEVLYLNGAGEVMSSNSRKYGIGQVFNAIPLDTAQDIFKIDENNQQWLYVVHYSKSSDTRLLMKVPVNSIISQHVNVQRWVNLAMIVYFLLLIILSFYFIQSILNPITRLARVTRSYEPGRPLSIRAKEGSKDEISLLNGQFIEMTNRLNQTIFEKYELELKNKEIELSILHTQINPHLLYNTLESIYWRTVIEGGTHSSEMIKDLSLIMRIGLSKGKLLISVADEIIHAEAYIRLQLFRYDYAFKVNWNLQEEAKACLIPKVVLQPLVENAIIHGIKQMDRDGELWISIRMQGGEVIVDVEDNGYKEPDIGKLDAILQGQEQNKGFGIINVQRRIQLHFGEGYGLHFSLGKEGGLKATLVIPAVSAEEQSLIADKTG